MAYSPTKIDLHIGIDLRIGKEPFQRDKYDEKRDLCIKRDQPDEKKFFQQNFC